MKQFSGNVEFVFDRDPEPTGRPFVVSQGGPPAQESLSGDAGAVPAAGTPPGT